MISGEVCSTVEVASRYFDLVEQGDIQALTDLYAPEVLSWNNVDRCVRSKEESVAALTAYIALVGSRRYQHRQVEAFAGGFVQRHVLVGRIDGSEVESRLHACIIGEVEDGRITKIDTYLDSAGLEQFRRQI